MKFLKIFFLSIFLINLTSCIYFDKDSKALALRDKALKICRSVDRNGEEAWYSYTEKEAPYKKARDKALEYNPAFQEDFADCDSAFATKNENLSEEYKASLVQGLQKMSKEMKCFELPVINNALLSSDYVNPQIAVDIHMEAKNRIIKAAAVSDLNTLLKSFPTEMKGFTDDITKCSDGYDFIAFKLKSYRIDLANIKEKKAALAKSLGYQGMWENQGISGMIASINSRDLSVNDAKNFLIERSVNFDSAIGAEEVIGNMVIYNNIATHIFERNFKFAMPKEKGEFYGKKAVLKGRHFAVTENRNFKIDGKIVDLLVIKRVDVDAPVKKKSKEIRKAVHKKVKAASKKR